MLKGIRFEFYGVPAIFFKMKKIMADRVAAAGTVMIQAEMMTMK